MITSITEPYKIFQQPPLGPLPQASHVLYGAAQVPVPTSRGGQRRGLGPQVDAGQQQRRAHAAAPSRDVARRVAVAGKMMEKRGVCACDKKLDRFLLASLPTAVGALCAFAGRFRRLG